MNMMTRTTTAPVLETGVVASGVYANGRRILDIPIEQAGQWAKKEGHIVWIGLLEPSAELLEKVRAQFDLHPLAIEDAAKAHQHPKVEQYGEALFVVARTAQMKNDAIAFGETHLFFFRRARLHHLGPPRRIDLLRRRAGTLRILPHRAGPWRGLHPLCDPRFHRR